MSASNRRTKEPWLAVCLSWLVPGVGQCYAGAWVTGAVFVLLWFGLQLAVAWQLFSVRGRLTGALLAVVGGLVVWVVAVIHAHRRARNVNPPEAEADRRRVRDPYLAVFLTQILPGVGHLYLKRWVAGPLLLVVSLVVWIVGSLLHVLLPAVVAALVFAVVLSAYEAGTSVWAYRRGPAERRRGPGGIAAVCILGMLVGTLPLAAALLVRGHVVEAFHVPVGSMAPTLQPGDRILVWKRPFDPRWGDIIVFLNPANRKERYVKRVAALPGETIEIRASGIYVDGRRLSGPPFGGFSYIEPFGRPLSDRKTYAGEGRPFTVPAGHVFVLGDNINRSFDSRFFGPVPVDDLVGRVYKRYWPPSREGPVGQRHGRQERSR